MTISNQKGKKMDNEYITFLSGVSPLAVLGRLALVGFLALVFYQGVCALSSGSNRQGSPKKKKQTKKKTGSQPGNKVTVSLIKVNSMNMDSIKQAYGASIRKGVKVRFRRSLVNLSAGRLRSGYMEGKVTRCTKDTVFVDVEHGGERLRIEFSPDDLEYLGADKCWVRFVKR